MNYSDKLKDPRWQRKRLTILNRDGWKCAECGVENRTLHVHHKRYSGEPWESPDADLITMCAGCHQLEEEIGKQNPLIKQFADKCDSTCIKMWLHVAGMSYIKHYHPKVSSELSQKMASLTNGREYWYNWIS